VLLKGRTLEPCLFTNFFLCDAINYCRYLLFADEGKVRPISFSTKANTLIYEYAYCQSPVTYTDPIKDLGVFLDSRPHPIIMSPM
jgi:hypothetical protein